MVGAAVSYHSVTQDSSPSLTRNRRVLPESPGARAPAQPTEVGKNSCGRLYTIEWQKRGLPHMHLLICLENQDKPKCAADVDRVIFAEIPDREYEALYYELVSKHMMHGPCGTQNPKCPCMVNNKCSKYYPKRYLEETTFDDGMNSYPIYRRQNNQRFVLKKVGRQDVLLDNRHVVPHNKALLLKYQSHINVEVCNNVKAIKYIYKYIYKGHDRANIQAEFNEISNFLQTRYVSAPEACWRIFAFKIDSSSHTIYRLIVHLPEQQRVSFQQGSEAEALRRAANTDTMLTAFFKYNNRLDFGDKKWLYYEMPLEHWFDKKYCKWRKRKTSETKVIGRMYMVSPKEIERYSLRLLLLYVRAPDSFEDLRTFRGVRYGTFADAARARELI